MPFISMSVLPDVEDLLGNLVWIRRFGWRCRVCAGLLATLFCSVQLRFQFCTLLSLLTISWSSVGLTVGRRFRSTGISRGGSFTCVSRRRLCAFRTIKVLNYCRPVGTEHANVTVFGYVYVALVLLDLVAIPVVSIPVFALLQPVGAVRIMDQARLIIWAVLYCRGIQIRTRDAGDFSLEVGTNLRLV